ncbi:hypothetical protein, partial [Bradyrhizobium sp. SRS-191]|uniref:hypothetical protein n=1 Tax=Bradyrhizobium sp. SRS-191 TaxID=2962606 RepID=UPI00211ED30C
LEQLCFVSALAQGHDVVLYSYTPEALQGVPAGVEIRDAREVMSEQRLVRYSDTGSFALGANFFRYRLLQKGLGYWVDADVYFVKPLNFFEEFVLGWEDGAKINNAVLLLPSDSEIVRDLCELPSDNVRPPWFGPRRSLQYYFARMTSSKGVRVQDLPWGTYGPEMLTYLAKKHKIAELAKEPSVFYPVGWRDARGLYGPAERIEAMIGPETCAVHMYNGALRELRDLKPPKGSYIDLACRKYGIDP